jgi:hypothetical protein
MVSQASLLANFPRVHLQMLPVQVVSKDHGYGLPARFDLSKPLNWVSSGLARTGDAVIRDGTEMFDKKQNPS